MPKTEQRDALEQRYLHLVKISLPSCARHEGWPISGAACFERVLLDNVCGGVWTDTLKARAGLAHIPDDKLEDMVRCGEALLKDADGIFDLNDRSVAWRQAKRTHLPAMAQTAA